MAGLSRICGNGGCARPFEAQVRHVAAGGGLYCSRSCASVVKARRWHATHSQAGPNNHNFKGWASRNRRRYVDAFRAANPLKARAHDAVRNALRTGVLVKPLRCECCGEQRPLAGHHDDYRRPLDVVWTCRSCHRVLDARRRVIEAERKAS